MNCPQCHQENPANNRFCGMCGAKLEAAKVKVDPSAPSVMWLENEEPKPQKPVETASREDAAKAARQREAVERAARDREMAERAARAAVRERELASRMGGDQVAVREREQQRNISTALSEATRRPVNVAGPSFLGLNEDDEPEPPAGRIEDDERSDIYGGGGRSYSRALLLLVVLLVVAGLLFLQWRYSRGLEASPPVAKPSASQPNDTASDDSQSKQEDAAAAKSESAAPTPQSDVAKSETPPQPPKSEPSKSSGAKQQATPGDSAGQADQQDDSEPAETAKPTNEQSKPSARGRVQAEPSLEQSDEPLRLAESYLQGRGLPKSCPKGVEILREASNRGNYKAQIKLGALYTTGNCVSVDRVQAYRYFTRALQTKPNNAWVEQNRSMLWTQMSEQERRQAMEQRF